MTKAVISGLPKLRIEETAARRQARIDRGEEAIVGVNRHRPHREEPVDFRNVETRMVRERQLEGLERIRMERDAGECDAALGELEACAGGGGNLLGAAIRAARARATVGEISMAMERVFGRHRAEARALSGVYGGAYRGDSEFAGIQERVRKFEHDEGRRPRMLVAKMGQDGHDRGAKVIATAFADMGFDVDIGPLFQTPEETARDAIDNDVHVIGVSTQSAGHDTLVPKLIEELNSRDAGHILVVCGGVIPPGDHDMMKSLGVAAIFGPGTNIPEAAVSVLELIGQRRFRG